MKYVDRLVLIADKFEDKIKKFSQKNTAPQIGESNQIPAIQDAFFGPPSTSKGQEAFLKFINNSSSNFQKSVQNVKGTIGIQVYVDAPSKKANFVVLVNPPVLAKQIIDALRKDYFVFYKELPEQQLQRRLSVGEIRPPSVSGLAPFTTM